MKVPEFFRVSPTKSGKIYAAVVIFSLVAAVNSGANLLFLAFGALVGAGIVSLFLSNTCLNRLTIKRVFAEHAVAGEPADIEYTLRNGKRFWPSIGVYLREVNDALLEAPTAFVVYIPARESLILPVRFVARRRGVVTLSKVELSCSFPFGFLKRTRVISVPQEMVVYPRIGLLNRHLALQYRESIESGTMTSTRRGGNEEFYGVREYRPGDNIRAIHWRSTARNHQLMIREMASNAPPQLIVVLNLRSWQPGGGSQDAAAVEQAIELAVALICYGFFENFAVGLAIAGLKESHSPSPQMGRDARSRMLRQLAVLNVDDILPKEGIDFPNRLAGRAEWIIVTLRGLDPIHDLLPPGAAAQPASFAGNSHRTVLSLDEPDAESWLRFLSSKETLRLLREKSDTPGKSGLSSSGPPAGSAFFGASG